jgi:hypothetical protein
MSMVFLTGHPDIDVFGIGALSDVDQIARIRSDESKIQKVFGVIVTGTAKPLPSRKDADRFLNALNSNKKRNPTLGMPVLLIIFTMQDDRGYVAWQTEPVIEGAEPKLRIPAQLATEPATKEVLESIVDRVSNWYDLLIKTLYILN